MSGWNTSRHHITVQHDTLLTHSPIVISTKHHISECVMQTSLRATEHTMGYITIYNAHRATVTLDLHVHATSRQVLMVSHSSKENQTSKIYFYGFKQYKRHGPSSTVPYSLSSIILLCRTIERQWSWQYS